MILLLDHIVSGPMATYALSTYRLRVRRKRGQEHVQLDDIDGSKTDFLYILVGFLREMLIAGLDVDSTSKSSTKLREPPVAKSRRISGFLQSGEYGIEEEIFDTKTRTKSRTKTPDEVGLKPFYFSFQIPKGTKDGIVVLQRYKQYGIKTVFMKLLNAYIKRNYPGFMIDVEYLVPSDYAESIISSGAIKKISFQKYHIPKDLTDEFTGGATTGGKTEIVVSASRNGILPVVSTFLKLFSPKENKTIKTLFVFDDEIKGFDYDNIKIHIVNDGIERTIDMSKLLNIRTDFDIDNIQRDEKGHLVFIQVDAYTSNLCEEMRKAINQDDPEALNQDDDINFELDDILDEVAETETSRL